MMEINYPNEILDADEVETHLPDGTPITYDDDIPELMQYKPMLTKADVALLQELDLPTGLEALKSRLDYDPDTYDGDKGIGMTHLDRARYGAGIWNLWVKLFKWEWVRVAKLQTPETPEIKFKSTLYSNRMIDFNPNPINHLSEDSRHSIEYRDFRSFCFPCKLWFRDLNLEYKFGNNTINFRNAIFCAYTAFRETIFEDEVAFDNTQFFRGVSFSKCRFNSYASFVGTVVKHDADFRSTTFNNIANFHNAQFMQQASFVHAIFEDDALFESGVFKGETYFDGSIFHNDARFLGVYFEARLSSVNAVFLSGALFDESNFQNGANFYQTQFLGTNRNGTAFSFENTNFSGYVSFDRVWFGMNESTPKPISFENWSTETKKPYLSLRMTYKSWTVPDFRGTDFKRPPNLGHTHIPAPPVKSTTDEFVSTNSRVRKVFRKFISFFGIAATDIRIDDPWAAAKYRRLQELAAQGHNHRAEARFFHGELLTRRGHETQDWREVLMINLFNLFSSCGLSAKRPFYFWLAFSLFFTFLYSFGTKLSFWQYSLNDLGHLFNYTLSNAALVGLFRGNDTVAVNALFGGPEGIPFWTSFVAGLHNLIASILLFLALLAIRNYFKMR